MFQFKEEYMFSNEIVEMFPLKKEHESELFEASNSVEIWEHFTENGFGANNFKLYIKNALEKRISKHEYPFVIKDKRKGKIAGMTRVYEVNSELRNVKIGHTWIGNEFQGTGLNKSCKYLLFKFLFEDQNFERIGFGASKLNIKSIKAMESVGCKIEGELRSFLPRGNGNERINIILLSILKNEWKNNVKNELKNKLKAYT